MPRDKSFLVLMVDKENIKKFEDMKDIFGKKAKVGDRITAMNETYTTDYEVVKVKGVKQFGKSALLCKQIVGKELAENTEYVRRLFLITQRGDNKFYTKNGVGGFAKWLIRRGGEI